MSMRGRGKGVCAAKARRHRADICEADVADELCAGSWRSWVVGIQPAVAGQVVEIARAKVEGAVLELGRRGHGLIVPAAVEVQRVALRVGVDVVQALEDGLDDDAAARLGELAMAAQARRLRLL